IDEAADHDAAVLFGRVADQRQLSLVQEAHGRHESHRIAGEATLQDGCPQVRDGAGDDHRLAAAAGRAGARPARGLLLLRAVGIAGAALSICYVVSAALLHLTLSDHRPIRLRTVMTMDTLPAPFAA